MFYQHPLFQSSNSASRGGISCVTITFIYFDAEVGWIYLWRSRALCELLSSHCLVSCGSCHVPFLYISFHSFSVVPHLSSIIDSQGYYSFWLIHSYFISVSYWVAECFLLGFGSCSCSCLLFSLCMPHSFGFCGSLHFHHSYVIYVRARVLG